MLNVLLVVIVMTIFLRNIQHIIVLKECLDLQVRVVNNIMKT